MEILKTQKGTLSVLTGQTDMGKSTMAVFNAAEELKKGKHVLFFSYEYCQSIIFNKLVSHFGLTWTDLYNFVVVDGRGIALKEIENIIENAKETTDVVYIDYLDLLRQTIIKKNPDLDRGTKIELLQDIVSKLADLAAKFNVSIVVLTRAANVTHIDDLVDWLTLVTAQVHTAAPTINMLISKGEALNPLIQSNDVSHVILVEGKKLTHFSSINLKEAYK